MTSRALPVVLGLLVAAVGAARIARAADVTIDGAVVARATTTMSIPVEVTEFREIGLCPHLLTGCAKPTVCITAPAPVPVLDGQLAGAAPARFGVGVEDGRAFAQCVLASLNTDTPGPRRRYVYCLRCEGVSAP
jgi:hypothetical protein